MEDRNQLNTTLGQARCCVLLILLVENMHWWITISPRFHCLAAPASAASLLSTDRIEERRGEERRGEGIIR